MQLVFVHITTSDHEEALRIGRALVEARLAACVNILDGMQSLYWWRGEIEGARETVLIAKSRESLLPVLVDKVKSIHSYECPCVVALPILGGNPDYVTWLRGELTPE